MRVTTISGMKTSLRHLIGLDALQSSEEDAAVASFNRFGKLAWDRTTWPFNCVLKQVIPDVRVRSVNVGSGGSGYGSVPAVTITGSAAGTATLNSDEEVNGIAVTAAGGSYTSAPAVTIAGPGGGGTTATATATIIAVLDFGTTMDTVFNVWTSDPFGASVPAPIAFRIEPEAGTSEYGLAVLDNHSSTAPVWVHYRTPFSSFGGSATDYPDLFAPYAVMGGYGDWLVADGQTSKGQEAFAQAESILASELDKLERQQNQQSRILMTTYGTTAASPS